jgi:hypothetical protein
MGLEMMAFLRGARVGTGGCGEEKKKGENGI